MVEEYKYKDITHKIIGAAMQVHKVIGNCFQEVIYQREMEMEMPYFELSFNREFEMPIFYREKQIGLRRVDFLVMNVIAVELKAVIKLEDVHLAQAINYLEAYNLEVGLLLNFGSKSLAFKRLINTKYNPVNS